MTKAKICSWNMGLPWETAMLQVDVTILSACGAQLMFLSVVGCLTGLFVHAFEETRYEMNQGLRPETT